MLRTLMMLCALAFPATSQSSYADGGSAQSSKPVWQVGDSWRVKRPVMSYHPSTGPFKTGEYTVVVSVLGVEKAVNGVECYVLEIRPGDDLPEHIKSNSDLVIERVYYATDTLALTQVERWKCDKDGKESKIGREATSAICPLSQVYYGRNGDWIPLLLPPFPLASGRADDHWKSAYGSSREEIEEDRDVPLSSTADIVVGPAAGKDVVAPGATMVTFYFTTTYSKSGDIRRKVAEQIWVPGKRWWSIARVYDGKEVTEFTLAE